MEEINKRLSRALSQLSKDDIIDIFVSILSDDRLYKTVISKTAKNELSELLQIKDKEGVIKELISFLSSRKYFNNPSQIKMALVKKLMIIGAV